ncbi:MAG: SPASM domain-containing protein, partial [Defluviitaleaceae bacterium]|nr:SPASM domain-containing protein [Defluviitaleaceae bacterium]
AIYSIITSTPMNPIYTHCYASENNLTFDPYGNMYSCLASVGGEELMIGTYYPSVYFKENSIFNRNLDNIPGCKECEYSLLCAGGCPVALPDYSDVFVPSCGNVKSRIHILLPLCYNAMKTRK